MYGDDSYLASSTSFDNLSSSLIHYAGLKQSPQDTVHNASKGPPQRDQCYPSYPIRQIPPERTSIAKW